MSALLEATNRARSSRGLSPLVERPDLDADAQAHSRDMARRGALDHDGFDARGTRYGRMAENVARRTLNIDGAKEVVQAWLDSPHHRRNLLGPFRFHGTGRATTGDGDEDMAYWTAEYAA